jgi:simple sugar transport system permease protein
MDGYFIVQQTMRFSIPLLIVALGGMFSERSGVVNIALEGIMLIGAFAGVLFISTFQHILPGQPILLIAIFVSAAAGITISLAHAYASINMKADQIISGTAINMFAGAFAIYVARTIGNVQQIRFENEFHIQSVPLLGRIPVLGPLFFQNAFITTYVGMILLVASWFVIFKTKLGLRLRACGEHPQAADSVGINVKKMRYTGVMLSGALAGIGGLVFIVPNSVVFDGTVSGYGFLALAVLIFGQWRPWRILFAAFFFGSFRALSITSTVIPWMANLDIAQNYYKMMPFIATLIILVFTSKRSQAPKAAGIPYDAGKR